MSMPQKIFVTKDSFYKAIDLTTILWGKYGYENLDTAISESAKKFNVNEKYIHDEFNKMEKFLQNQNNQSKVKK